MGKSRGGKYHKKAPRRGPGEEEESSEEEEFIQRGVGGQRANVGMLPPSDSEEEAEGEEGAEPKPKKEADASTSAAAAGGQSKTAGKMPPSDSEEEDDDDDDDDSDDDPTPEYLRAAPTARKKEPAVEPRSEEQLKKDFERLEIIKKKREEDRLKRIATEGWDRYAPVSDTNRPPGSVPTDHPSNKK